MNVCAIDHDVSFTCPCCRTAHLSKFHAVDGTICGAVQKNKISYKHSLITVTEDRGKVVEGIDTMKRLCFTSEIKISFNKKKDSVENDSVVINEDSDESDDNEDGGKKDKSTLNMVKILQKLCKKNASSKVC